MGIRNYQRGAGNYLPPVDRQGLKQRDRVTNPQSKFLTQNCSCLKELQGQKMEKRLREKRFSDWPKLGSISKGCFKA